MKSRIKSLASDTLIYGVSTIVGRFLTFLLTPIYSNYLNGAEYGDAIYIFSFVAFVNIIYSFGMDTAYMRFFDKNDNEYSKKVFTMAYLTIAVISGFITIIVIIFADLIAPALTDLKSGPEIVKIAALIPFLDAVMFVPYAFLRMTRRPMRFALTKLALIFIAVASNAVFVVILRWQALGIFYSQFMANIVGALIFIPMIVSHFNWKLDWKLMKQMLRYGIPTIPATLSSLILQIADRPILKILSSSESVAMYTINHRLGIPIMLFVSVFEYAWKPFYLSHHEDADAKDLFSRIFTYFTLACAIIFLITGFFIEFIVRMPFIGGKFINPAYWSGIGIIPVILGGYFLNGWYNNFAAGFHIQKKTDYLPISIGAAALTNIALNFILVPIFDYWGAAYAMLGAYAVAAVILFSFLRKVYPVKYEFIKVLIIIVVMLVIYFATIWLSGYLNIWASFSIRIFSMAVFIITLRMFGFFSNEEIKKIISIFRKEKKL
jgi:O-antigen/teichoic acid export membrane protein